MTPQIQLIKHDPDNGRFGDCYRTCIASILDLHPSEVPHFYSGKAGDQRAHAVAWLAVWGLNSFQTYYDGGATIEAVLYTTGEMCPGVPLILSGESRLGVNHSVVVMDGKIVSDPSGNGIIGPCDDGLIWVEAITVGAEWNARGIKRRDGADHLESMSEDERRRWDDGRSDWRDSDWQDCCGQIDCPQCNKESEVF